MSQTTSKLVCLSIAGLDPSGGAGVLADIKAFNAFGCFGTAAVTSVTFQNTKGVFGAEHISGEAVRRQVEPIFDDLDVAAVKTGMLPTRDIIAVVADIMDRHRNIPLVVDPVVRSTSGFDLIDDAALSELTERLFPLATVVTPNLVEAERIAVFRIASGDELDAAGKRLLSMGPKNVLIKGGHRVLGELDAVDRLYRRNESLRSFTSDWIETSATHGTGCVLSAAIAASLAKGLDISEAIRQAKKFVTNAIRTSPMLGHGHSPTNI